MGRLETWVLLAVAGVVGAGVRVEVDNMLVLKRSDCLHIRVRLQERPV